MTVPSTVLVGTGGYGLRHLRSLLELDRAGRIRLAGLVDVAPSAEAADLVAGHPARWYPDLDAAPTSDSVVIATPPHTHFAPAAAAIRRGAAVYLEKPPVPLLQELDELTALPARRRVEVGFQGARATVEQLELGWIELGRPAVEKIVAHGALSRPAAYYGRSAWAGEWFLDGRAVLDGPLFNPLAHVVQAALLFARRVAPGWAPALVEAECFRVRDIGGDDTSAFRVAPVAGPPVLAVGTTATDTVVQPGIAVHTAAGVVRVTAGEVPPATPALHATVTRPDERPDPLLTLAATRHFVLAVNAAVQATGCPAPAPVRATGEVAVEGLGRLVSACADSGLLLSEVDPAWAGAPRRLAVAGYRGLVHRDLAPAVGRGAG